MPYARDVRPLVACECVSMCALGGRWVFERRECDEIAPEKALFHRIPGFDFRQNAACYDFIFVSVLHFGHTTRIVPFPRGTESSCPQCLQRKYFVVLRLDHFFFASS